MRPAKDIAEGLFREGMPHREKLVEAMTKLILTDRAALLLEVEDAIHREAEAFGDEDIASAIVTVAGVAIDSLRAS